MKRHLSALTLAGLTIVAGRADWVIESRVDTQQTKLNITAKLADEFVRISELPGPVVRSETNARGQTSKMTMISVKEQKIDRSVFEVPADYQPGPRLPGTPDSPRK